MSRLQARLAQSLPDDKGTEGVMLKREPPSHSPTLCLHNHNCAHNLTGIRPTTRWPREPSLGEGNFTQIHVLEDSGPLTHALGLPVTPGSGPETG